jgi:hypothetical protein
MYYSHSDKIWPDNSFDLPKRQVRKTNPQFTVLTLIKNGHLCKTHGEYEVDTTKLDYVLKISNFCYYFLELGMFISNILHEH